MNELMGIENKILVIRGQQVMLDRDLAELYGVETKRLNEAVRRNPKRFPERNCFILSEDEIISTLSRSQLATLKIRGKNIKYKPHAFTEQGVAMLATVLSSDIAIEISLKIMDAFVAMRRFLLNNAKIFTEIDSIKQHLISSDIQQKESEKRIDTLFTPMDKYKIEDKQGVFVQGQYTNTMQLIIVNSKDASDKFQGIFAGVIAGQLQGTLPYDISPRKLAWVSCRFPSYRDTLWKRVRAVCIGKLRVRERVAGIVYFSCSIGLDSDCIRYHAAIVG